MASESTDQADHKPQIQDFLDEPTRDIADWQWLWEGDHAFPLGRGRGWGSRLVVGLKAVLRPLVKFAIGDVWERQRVFNLILLEHSIQHRQALDRQHREALDALAPLLDLSREHGDRVRTLETRADAQQGRSDSQERDLIRETLRLDERIEEEEKLDSRIEQQEQRGDRIEEHSDLQDKRADEVLKLQDSRTEKQAKRADKLEHRASHLEAFLKEGLEEIMRYSDALYTRVDQKLDRYRLESREVGQQMASALVAIGQGGEEALRTAVNEGDYRELEARHRGTAEEITERARTYLEVLKGREKVLDLGCGRGEVLGLFADNKIGCSGIDSSRDMVRICEERGLEVEQAEILEYLAGLDQESLDAVVSFHVIEHLPATSINNLVRLAWRALEPGGVLILETPNPLSISVAASSFWRDPTHLRPIHPDALWLSLELAGFENMQRLELRPFPKEDRLPELDVEDLDEADKKLVHQINVLRDRLDETLFGFQDYAILGYKRK